MDDVRDRLRAIVDWRTSAELARHGRSTGHLLLRPVVGDIAASRLLILKMVHENGRPDDRNGYALGKSS